MANTWLMTSWRPELHCAALQQLFMRNQWSGHFLNSGYSKPVIRCHIHKACGKLRTSITNDSGENWSWTLRKCKFITVTEFNTRSLTPSIKFHTTKPHKTPVSKMLPLNLWLAARDLISVKNDMKLDKYFIRINPQILFSYALYYWQSNIIFIPKYQQAFKLT